MTYDIESLHQRYIDKYQRRIQRRPDTASRQYFLDDVSNYAAMSLEFDNMLYTQHPTSTMWIEDLFTHEEFLFLMSVVND